MSETTKSCETCEWECAHYAVTDDRCSGGCGQTNFHNWQEQHEITEERVKAKDEEIQRLRTALSRIVNGYNDGRIEPREGDEAAKVGRLLSPQEVASQALRFDFPEADYTGVELRLVSRLLTKAGFYPAPHATVSKLFADFIAESTTPEIRAQRKTAVFGFLYGGTPVAELVAFLEGRLDQELERDKCYSCTYEYNGNDPRCSSGNCPN